MYMIYFLFVSLQFPYIPKSYSYFLAQMSAFAPLTLFYYKNNKAKCVIFYSNTLSVSYSDYSLAKDFLWNK